jgi:hypothetical protein
VPNESGCFIEDGSVLRVTLSTAILLGFAAACESTLAQSPAPRSPAPRPQVSGQQAADNWDDFNLNDGSAGRYYSPYRGRTDDPAYRLQAAYAARQIAMMNEENMRLGFAMQRPNQASNPRMQSRYPARRIVYVPMIVE